jgi:hypothetical protein
VALLFINKTNAHNLSGGWTTWRHMAAAAESARGYLPESRAVPPEPARQTIGAPGDY